MLKRHHYNLHLPFTFTPIETVKNSYEFIEDVIPYSQMMKKNMELIKWLHFLGLYIKDTRCFHSLPHQTYKKHIDSNETDLNGQIASKSDVVKLNFIFNSTGTVMRWYNLLPERRGIFYKNPRGENVMGFSESDIIEVYKAKVDNHCILDAGTIHDLTNGENNNTNRICYSSILEDRRSLNLTWDKATEIFKPYIY